MAYKERYKKIEKQIAYENACDCQYYGMGSKEWVAGDLTKEERKEVWALAFWDMAEPDIEHGNMIGGVYHFAPAYR